MPASELQNQTSEAFARVHHSGVLDSLDRHNASEIRRRLERYTKFLFVRHPLERLLSAYRSKFQTLTPRTEYYRRHFGNIIARRYRGARGQRQAPVDNVTFPEFVRFVIEWRSPFGIDQHWNPISNLCHPLAVGFDFVGRYESLDADADWLLRRIGANFSFPRCAAVPAERVRAPPRMRASRIRVVKLWPAARVGVSAALRPGPRSLALVAPRHAPRSFCPHRGRSLR